MYDKCRWAIRGKSLWDCDWNRARTGLLVVAASEVGLVVLLPDDGGLASIGGRRAHPQSGGVVAQEALASKWEVLQRGTRRVYL